MTQDAKVGLEVAGAEICGRQDVVPSVCHGSAFWRDAQADVAIARARPEAVVHRSSARSLASHRARTQRPGGGRRRAFLLARDGDARARVRARRVRVGQSDSNPAAVAREGSRRPVRASSPRFDGAGGVRGVVGNARGASAPARAAGGGAEVPSKGGEPKKRRGKHRRRAPGKNDGASASEKVSDKIAPSSAAAALAIAASVDPDAATIARFMGTLDESDAGADGGFLLGAKTKTRAARGAVFMGTVDDDETSRMAFSRTTRRRTSVGRSSEKSNAKSERSEPKPLAVPPSNGDPDLAFLYDADAVRSISMCDEKNNDLPDVNDEAVVARCNQVLRSKRSMDDVLFSVREMTAAGVRPAESTYVAIMLVCRDTAVGPARAVEVYDAMKLVGVKPTARSFDLAMTCAIRARKPEDALRLKEDCASDFGLRLSPRTFTALLKCVSECDFGRKRGAKARLIRTCRLFEEMLEETSGDGKNEAIPPPAAFNVLIAAARARVSRTSWRARSRR